MTLSVNMLGLGEFTKPYSNLILFKLDQTDLRLLYCNIIIERSVYDCINHVKYVNNKNSTFEEIFASMSKLDAEDKLDADKLRTFLSGMIENQLLKLSDNVNI